MVRQLLRTTAFATMLVLAGGAFVAPAFAEVVYNRGSAADPESLDPHKTSTVYEADIMRDLFMGLVMQDAKANLIPRRR
jgi:oligopeptide transport system substrate-binding protein